MIKNHKRLACAILLSLGSFCVNAEADDAPMDDDASNKQTIIESKAPPHSDVKYTYVKDKSADQTPGDAAMLFHIPGLTLTESGGPLSPSQIRYRGLSHARFRVELEGLWLNNPITGMADANSMFLFAAKNLQTNAQSLSITLPTVEYPQAKGVIGYGSQRSIKFGGTAGTPLGKSSTIFAAAQAYSTNGKFYFQSPDDKSVPAQNFLRENNDQHRLQALAKYLYKTENEGAHALVAFNAHEGGIAGFAMEPTKDLRNRAIYGGMRVGGSKKINQTIFSIDVVNSLFDFRTTDVPPQNEHFIASTHEITFGFERLGLPSWFDFDFANQIVIERAYDLDITRIGGGFIMNRAIRFSGKLKPTISGQLHLLGFQEHGIVTKSDFGLSIEPSQWSTVTARFMRSERLPTFMETNAQNQFFVGNPNLEKEGVWDFELGTNLKFGDHTRVQLTGFLGYLSSAIVNVPLNNRQFWPVNVETASRHGVDLSVIIAPTNFLMVETKNSLLSTHNNKANAPLPQAPGFLGFTKVRFGDESTIALSLQSRYRGSATGAVDGSLDSPAYMLFDAVASARLLELIDLSISVTNIFNIKTARDLYEIPLPGTMFFAQIEVGNV